MNSKKAAEIFEEPRADKSAANASSDYRALLAQREALDEQIARVREEEVGAVLEQIRQLVADYGLEAEVQFTNARAQSGRGVPRGPVAAKYRDPDSGATWSGRGKAPSWIADKDRDRFLIA